MAKPEARAGVYIGLGANLPSPEHGTPRETLEAAMRMLERAASRSSRVRGLYESEPVPVSDQPWYLNAVVEVATDQIWRPKCSPLLHSVENAFGRVRGRAQRGAGPGSRPAGLSRDGARGPESLVLPHPRLVDRAFVLLPLARHRAGLAPSGQQAADRRIAGIVAGRPADPTFGALNRRPALAAWPDPVPRLAYAFINNIFVTTTWLRFWRSSRMARVTVEDCVMKVPNRFDLVMVASQRARRFPPARQLTLERDNDKNPVVGAARDRRRHRQYRRALRTRS